MKLQEENKVIPVKQTPILQTEQQKPSYKIVTVNPPIRQPLPQTTLYPTKLSSNCTYRQEESDAKLSSQYSHNKKDESLPLLTISKISISNNAVSQNNAVVPKPVNKVCVQSQVVPLAKMYSPIKTN